jgi:hypothetical protein
MRVLFGAVLLLAGSALSFGAANAEGGCGPGWHRGAYGRCFPNRGPVVVAPGAPVVVERPVVVAAAPMASPGATDAAVRSEAPISSDCHDGFSERVAGAVLMCACLSRHDLTFCQSGVPSAFARRPTSVIREEFRPGLGELWEPSMVT